jgi:hypothetical protein
LAGKEMHIKDEIVDNYRKGSKPTESVSEKEIADFKKVSLELVTKMESDLESETDLKYTTYTTSFNVTLNSIEDAIKFNNVHEGLHLGYAMAMKKLVIK